MKQLTVIVAMLATSFGTNANPIQSATMDQPVCFGREYSEKHMNLAKNSKQTVKRFLLKFQKFEWSGDNSAMLDIEAKIKRGTEQINGETHNTYKNYTSGMGCSIRNANEISCGIDCDGGSAKIRWKLSEKNKKISFINEGFVMVGGCGDEGEEHIWLEAIKGGDDVFELYALPQEFCQN